MSYQKETYVRIKAEFSKKYLEAQRRAQMRRAELHAQLPEVAELDRRLSMTGMEIMDALTSGGNTEAKLAEVKVRNEQLQRERAKILRANGYDENYSDVHYECEKCGDSGYLEHGMCDCMKRALTEAGYEASGLGGLIRTQSFENFSLDYYTSTVESRERIERSVLSLRRFAEQFEEDTYKNFLLVGGTGLGKTHLSTAMAKTIIDRGHDVLYVTALGMLGDFEAKRFGDGVGVRNDPMRYTDAQVLIIDDLGTEVNNQFTTACLYDVINHRINQRKTTVINTNLSVRDIEARYGERIASRILGEYVPILFEGKDVRRQKIFGKKK
ncbi:MAG: ATP-binding protein [Clostridia bacterium]|nr:ATP-binding protein [Clostridia bacterium]